MRQQKRVLSAGSPKDEREDPNGAEKPGFLFRSLGAIPGDELPTAVQVAESDEPSPTTKGVKRQTEVVILSRPPEPTERISWIPAVIGLGAVVACSIATTVIIISSRSASSSPTQSPGPMLTIPPVSASAPDRAPRSDARAHQGDDRVFPAALAMADMTWDQGDRANAQKQYAALVANFPSGILPARVLERARDTP